MLKRNQVLLDTNAIFFISGVKANSSIDIEALKNCINNGNVQCSYISLFEVVNNKSLTNDEKNTIFKTIAKNSIVIIHDIESLDNYHFNLLVNDKTSFYYNSIRTKLGKAIIERNLDNYLFFIKLYMYTSITLVVDKYINSVTEEKKRFREHFEVKQKDINKHIRNLIKANLEQLLENDCFNVTTINNYLITLSANVMKYYYEFLAKFKKMFECNYKTAYMKAIKEFNKTAKAIKNNSLNDIFEYDYKYISVCKMLVDGIKEVGVNIKEDDIRAGLLTMARETIHYENEEEANEFEENWMMLELNSMLINSGKFHSNDFMDYQILRMFYYNKDIELCITFDKKMIKIMESIKDDKRFAKSIDAIRECKRGKNDD